MSILGNIFSKFNRNYKTDTYEFCPRCDANLTLQIGYDNELPYWICKGCGEMLINPSIDDDENITWRCDNCTSMLNIQPGFNRLTGNWTCTECGYVNSVEDSDVYETDAEYQASLQDPYKGLSNEDVLKLTDYEDLGNIDGRSNVLLIKSYEDGQKYVKKYLKDYDISVYRYLYDHPVQNMPKLHAIYEGLNNLIVIEDYIDGETLAEIIHERGMLLNQKTAINIAIDILKILSDLHSIEKPIIHRDVKPSNVILSYDGKIYLLDMNVAKWYRDDEVEDTKLYATQHYAAPEQFGYGFTASSEKTDIYAVGILLNEMITGKLPKEAKAEGPVWDIIEKSISLEPNDRYTAYEMIMALGELVLKEQ